MKPITWWFTVSVLVTNAFCLEYDSYGRYFYDRYGNREYTSCFDYSARTVDACRLRTYSNDPYDRSYSSYDNNYRTIDRYAESDDQDGIYLGKGEFQVYGRDVEMVCEFPYSTNIVSAITWQKLQQDYGYSAVKRWNEVYDYNNRMQVTSDDVNKSKLLIRDWDQRDEGVYRCVGSRAGSNYRYKESVYMEVEFSPDQSGSSGYRQYNTFDDVFEGRVVNPSRPYYSSYYPN